MNVRRLAFTTVLPLAISGCGQSYNPERDEDCLGCDLSKADLTEADLTHANLSEADLSGADLDGVIGADFSGARNVNPKYLKD